MKWIENFDLFLFDFDGLLVNTETLHYQAYQKMCAAQGVKLEWSFKKYCEIAHFSSTGLKENLLKEYPKLKESGMSWDGLYQEKKSAYLETYNEMLTKGGVALMPGVERLLEALSQAKKRRCVVTHSPLEQIEKIRAGRPELSSIPLWLTREDYSNPKPAPDGYLLAIQKLGKEGDRIVGFEDSFKGYQSLCGAPCKPVIISDIYQPDGDVTHFASFEAIPENWTG